MSKNKTDIEGAFNPPEARDDIPIDLIEIPITDTVEVTDDEVCIAVKEDDVPDNILKAVLWGLAEEQSALKTLRQQRSNAGKDTSSISLKRGTLLKHMSETLIQRQALMGTMSGEMDLRGPKFREVFKMLLNIISDTFEEVKVPTEYKEMFFHALANNLEGWEDRAEKIIKAMTPKV